MPDYKLAVNEENKATELPLCRINGTRAQNPHMRAFWASTISFFIAFVGWFALAPVALDVAFAMEICENQEYPPKIDTMENMRRKPYLKYKNLKTDRTYCRYGRNDKDSPTDCKPIPQAKICGMAGTDPNECVNVCGIGSGANAPDCVDEIKHQFDVKALGKCVCTGGTDCRDTLTIAGIASVASTIFVRVALGTLLERFGPSTVQSSLMIYGAIWVALSAAITSPWNYILIRFFIGAAGATFVTNQFWCSLMFAPNVIGTANATAAGWGNLGGGVTQIFVGVVLMGLFEDALGMENEAAWRVSMIVPAVIFLVVGICIKLLSWDTPTAARYHPSVTGKHEVSLWDYVECSKDIRVWVMVFQYSACFGTELAMNNQLATHFRTYFQMRGKDAAALASSFGLMNLFARSLGGIFSDFLFKFMGFRGRIWAQFLALFFEAIFLFAFGSVTNDQEWYVALIVLIVFSLFVQMAEGTSYGIVPFMNKEQLAVVSAMVGAGGNLGAVIAGFAFYRPIDDDLLPFKVHAGYVMFWALLSPVYYWREHGGMFCGPDPNYVPPPAASKNSQAEPKANEGVAPADTDLETKAV